MLITINLDENTKKILDFFNTPMNEDDELFIICKNFSKFYEDSAPLFNTLFRYVDKVRSISLSHNLLHELSVKNEFSETPPFYHLCNFIASCKNLAHILLVSSRLYYLKDKHFKALFLAISNCKYLEKIELSGNHMMRWDVDKLRFIQYIPSSLKYLYLRSNFCFHPDETKEKAELRVKKLIFIINQIQDNSRLSEQLTIDLSDNKFLSLGVKERTSASCITSPVVIDLEDSNSEAPAKKIKLTPNSETPYELMKDVIEPLLRGSTITVNYINRPSKFSFEREEQPKSSVVLRDKRNCSAISMLRDVNLDEVNETMVNSPTKKRRKLTI